MSRCVWARMVFISRILYKTYPTFFFFAAHLRLSCSKHSLSPSIIITQTHMLVTLPRTSISTLLGAPVRRMGENNAQLQSRDLPPGLDPNAGMRVHE